MVFIYAYDLARTKELLGLESEVEEGRRFASDSICIITLTEHDRSTSPRVASSNDTLLRKDKDRARTFDVLLDVFNSVHEVFALHNEQTD